MSITGTTVVNMALARIGEAPVASLDEGTSAASAAALVYDTIRRSVIQSYPWSFATKTARLARLALTPPDFSFAYDLPNKCLQAIRLQKPRGAHPSQDEPTFLVREGMLCTDAPVAILEYVEDVEDPNFWEPRFLEAMVIRLAAELAMPVGAKAELAVRYRQEYEEIVRQSAGRSASQYYEELDDNPYLTARL